MIALLSLSFAKWQSVQLFVSLVPATGLRKFLFPPRTVCGTFVLNAMPDIPHPEIVCCW